MFKFRSQRFGYPKWSTAKKADWHFKFKKEPRFGLFRRSFWMKVDSEKFWDYLLPGLIILELVVFSALFAVIFQLPQTEEKIASPVSALPKEEVSCLQNTTSVLFAVIIDNEIHSRPPAGLSKADLIYEAPAEAGITRFLAVYCTGGEIPLNPPLIKGETEGDFPIGPVRSLRPYFLEWAEELGAPIVHVGGSSEALGKVKVSNIPDLDQYYNGKYFWRASDKIAPHNVFTNLEKLTEFLKKRFPNFETPTRSLPLFKGEIPLNPPLIKGEMEGDLSVKSVSIDFIRPEHLVKWEYDKNTNSYFRYQNGSEHKDVDGAKITAKNIIIQTTDIEIIDEIGRRKIRLSGEGKAMVFQDGRMTRGVWRKANDDSRTRFYNSAGEEIQFNEGKIWIEIVADYHKISISN